MGWDDDGNFINETERRSAPEPKAEQDRQTIEFGPLAQAFREQLLACLDECAQGRHGLFSDREHLEGESSWPEAAQLRQLAFALQAIMAQSEESDVLCDQFLDLCSIHGESDPGEPRLARAFLSEIAGGH